MTYTVEADRGYSLHTGMVFGNYVSDADRKPRVLRWLVIRDSKVMMFFRTKREAQAYADRRNAGSADHV